MSYAVPMERCGLDGHRLVDDDADPLIGRTIDRYEIGEMLGSGAMARVYAAKHSFLDHEYAIKILMGQIAVDQTLAERFRREAQAVSKIKHRNIVQVLDFGVTPEGVTFLAMELLRGLTLAQYIRDKEVTHAEAASITRQIASGLRAAQKLGFVHRDLKPGNVMIVDEAGENVAKVLDFGLVQVKTDEDTRLTKTGQVFGTPAYMAPEQVEGQLVGPKADFYALGAILYELLTGSPPFTGGLHLVLAMHVTEKPKPIPEHGKLGDLALWLLAKDPKDRPDDAKAILKALDATGLAKPLPRMKPPTDTYDSSPFVEPTKTINDASMPPPSRPSLGHSVGAISRSFRSSRLGSLIDTPQKLLLALTLVIGILPGWYLARTAYQATSRRGGDTSPLEVAAMRPEVQPPSGVAAAPETASADDAVAPIDDADKTDADKADADKTDADKADANPPPKTAEADDPAKKDTSAKSSAVASRRSARSSSRTTRRRSTSGSPRAHFRGLDSQLRKTLSSRGLSLNDIQKKEPARVKMWKRFRSGSPPKVALQDQVSEALMRAAKSFYISKPFLKSKLAGVLKTLQSVPAHKQSSAAFKKAENNYVMLRREVEVSSSADSSKLARRIAALSSKARRLR